MGDSRFQFKGFSIARSLIERKENNPLKKLSIKFTPKGYIDKEKSNFRLYLDVKIMDESNSVNIEISAIANYIFENELGLDELGNYFYINAPALLFPYIRAYISTLTNLSGLETITLPTLNMTKIGDDLRENTQEIVKNAPNS